MAHLQTAENAEVILKKRGVPDKFINAIAKRKKGSKAYIFIPFAWIPILLFSVIPFHDFYFQILYTIYPIRASQSDLFFPDGLSMMVVFGLMVILGLSLPAWAMLGYFYQSALDPILDEDILYKVAVKIRSISFGEDINSLRPNPNFLRFSGLLSEDEFLSAVAGVDREARKSARAPVRRFIIAVFSSQCLITTMAVLWMHYSYANIFNNTLELSAPFFHRKVSMAEITSAKTACIYQPTRSNPTNYSSYYFITYNGLTSNILRAQKLGRQMTSEEYIATLESLDKSIMSSGASVEKMSPVEASHCIDELPSSDPAYRAKFLHILTGQR